MSSKPWHQVLQLRDDLKSGELSLAVFAADLYDVIMGRAKSIYQDPQEFFALTYPTLALRNLAKDVILRLSGLSEKAIRQLAETYGGGKTHTLITLLHLVLDPEHLPELPCVQEFITHAGVTPPKTRVCTLTFDKLDVEKGMEVRSPSGELRWLKNPWSIIAFQIAGDEGLKILNAENLAEERDSAPAENLLAELLAIPKQQGLATLILIDEVLMYAHGKIGLDPKWRMILLNFFQYLTQAVSKTSNCIIVASLLASEIDKNDTFGRDLSRDISSIFQRQEEEKVEPVSKDEVAEVLRRRLFVADSIGDRQSFKPHVLEAMKGILNLDEQSRKERGIVEERFMKSYPFHPDLTDIFYTKWTQLDQFQRTRGVLRTFAIALRDAEKWDKSPLIGTNVFIGKPERSSLSESAIELTRIATVEEYEGKRQDWNKIIEGELAKAKEIQNETVGIKGREIEQAVFATFLHSQPIGQKAQTRELLLLLGQTNPDKIQLEKALQQWLERSWFLDEESLQEIDEEAGQKLPKSWRLGSKPNLTQMHAQACKDRVSDERVKSELLNEIKLKRIKQHLTDGVALTGAKVNFLPLYTKDVADDREFHYVVLDFKAVSSSGNPSAYASKFINENTGPDNPRTTNRNLIVLVVPERLGLSQAENKVRQYLGWLEVQEILKDQELDESRKLRLKNYIDSTKSQISEAIIQAYSVVVTLAENNEIQAIKLTVTGESPLFIQIKADKRLRINEMPLATDALLPDSGAYDLWHEGEKSRYVKDIVGAFGQNPQLPKMLNQQSIFDTLTRACLEGIFVLRVMRPDRSYLSWWHELPDHNWLSENSLEVVLPQYAKVTELSSDNLQPNFYPQLWQNNTEIRVCEIYDYFSGKKVIQIPSKDGLYEEPLFIPFIEKDVINQAIATSISTGKLCLINDEASFWEETIPLEIITKDSLLKIPPSPISFNEILPEQLSECWSESKTIARNIQLAISKKFGYPVPWKIVSQAIDGAIKANHLRVSVGSEAWPCNSSETLNISLEITQKQTEQSISSNKKSRVEEIEPIYVTSNLVKIASAQIELGQLQDLADNIGEIKHKAVGMDLRLFIKLELSGTETLSEEIIAEINQILQTEVSDILKFE